MAGAYTEIAFKGLFMTIFIFTDLYNYVKIIQFNSMFICGALLIMDIVAKQVHRDIYIYIPIGQEYGHDGKAKLPKMTRGETLGRNQTQMTPDSAITTHFYICVLYGQKI